jgi:hypothetical protein
VEFEVNVVDRDRFVVAVTEFPGKALAAEKHFTVFIS